MHGRGKAHRPRLGGVQKIAVGCCSAGRLSSHQVALDPSAGTAAAAQSENWFLLYISQLAGAAQELMTPAEQHAYHQQNSKGITLAARGDSLHRQSSLDPLTGPSQGPA